MTLSSQRELRCKNYRKACLPVVRFRRATQPEMIQKIEPKMEVRRSHRRGRILPRPKSLLPRAPHKWERPTYQPKGEGGRTHGISKENPHPKIGGTSELPDKTKIPKPRLLLLVVARRREKGKPALPAKKVVRKNPPTASVVS